jgi:hypothetical protein
MKAKDLKVYLEKLPKAELTDIALDIYKMLPKAKRQEVQLQLLLAHSAQKKNKKQPSLRIEELRLEQFVRNARLLHYLYPNEVVTAKARKNWKIRVRKWFKNLTDPQRTDINLSLQAELLEQLYVLLCEACEHKYFRCEDPFQAIGITQLDFYREVLLLWQSASGKEVLIEKGMELMIFNALNTYTLYAQLMVVYLTLLDSNWLQARAIEHAQKLLAENNFDASAKRRLFDSASSLSEDDYWHEQVHNNLIELIYRMYTRMGHVEKAIDFFKQYYYERNNEIRLYVLVRLLFEGGNQERIRYEIERALQQGIKPRPNLLSLLEGITSTGQLPQFI